MLQKFHNLDTFVCLAYGFFLFLFPELLAELHLKESLSETSLYLLRGWGATLLAWGLNLWSSDKSDSTVRTNLHYRFLAWAGFFSTFYYNHHNYTDGFPKYFMTALTTFMTVGSFYVAGCCTKSNCRTSCCTTTSTASTATQTSDKSD